MKVGIIGSWRPSPEWPFVGEQSDFENFCQELGFALASRSIQIVVGNDNKSTADYFVVKGYCKAANSKSLIEVVRPKDNKYPFRDLIAENKENYSRLFSYPVRKYTTWQHTRIRFLQSVDRVIAIGGRDQTPTNFIHNISSTPLIHDSTALWSG